MADAAVGKYFDSYDSLKSFVKDYEQINFVQLSVDKSRKLETQKAKSVMNTKLGCSKSDLMYSSIKYKCIHGGKFKSQGNGNRKTNTFKQECPFTLKVNLSADKQRLKISELVPSHNHEVSESIFKSLPRQRTLDSEERKKVQQMLSLKCNKKFLKEHIVKSTGKNVIRKPTQLKEGSVEKFFEETLTPYAWEMVSKEVEEASKMEFCFDINAKIDKCDCVFFINSNLPCRHILFKRKEAGITLTTKEIIPNKFTREGHYGTFCNNPLTFETALPVPINILSPVSTQVLTKQEKYKKAIQVCSDIASIVSDYGSKHFERALEELLKYKSNLLENNYLLDSVLVEKLEDDVLPTENVELGELSSDNMVEEVGRVGHKGRPWRA